MLTTIHFAHDIIGDGAKEISPPKLHVASKFGELRRYGLMIDSATVMAMVSAMFIQ